MYAYRFKDNRGNIREGHSDDREHGAGWKMVEVLREKNVEAVWSSVLAVQRKTSGTR